MAKAKKENTGETKKRGKYDEPLKVNGSFLNIMQASMKDADNKSTPKKKP
jgi:hypothetical protein